MPVIGSHEPAAWHWSAAAQVTGFAPAHVPAWQVSVRVQALPSSHALPSGRAGLEHMPVAGSQVPASWHWSAAAQTTATPPHAPLRQTSSCVQASPSSHALPSGLAGLEHMPVVGSHEPASWHWSAAAQTTWTPPHAPLRQTSSCVQALPSSHALPSGLAGLEHMPVAGSQVPASWHWSAAAQTTWTPPHAPLRQTSSCVQASPSSHALPSGLAGLEQVPVVGSQVPASWHWSAAAQTTWTPPHAPLRQTSSCVQASPSSHALPSGLAGLEHMPVVGSQVPASWHWSAAAQTTWTPPHAPPRQTSSCV